MRLTEPMKAELLDLLSRDPKPLYYREHGQYWKTIMALKERGLVKSVWCSNHQSEVTLTDDGRELAQVLTEPRSPLSPQ